jgi:hypothetical protein
MRWRDRLIGIVLGAVLGVGIVTAFVFLYSEQTVDAPSLSNHGKSGERRAPPVRTVHVVGGVPPSSGPAELHFRKDDLVRLRVVSDAAVDVELLGYGITRAVPAGEATPIRFRASKAGSFPLIVSASHIDVARITIGARAP